MVVIATGTRLVSVASAWLPNVRAAYLGQGLIVVLAQYPLDFLEDR